MGSDAQTRRLSEKETALAHQVKFSIRDRDLGKIDLELDVKSGGKKLGELHVSKGGVDWYPKNKQQPISLTWVALSRLIEGSE
jgi:hypothetical protein